MRAWSAGLAAAMVVGTVGYAVIGSAAPAYADDVREAQRQLAALRVEQAHRHSRGGGVTVAVLGSGVDASHPDLQGSVRPGSDLTGQDSDGTIDPTGRGTALAGLIAGHGHGGPAGEPGPDGVLGLAPGAELLPVVVHRPGGSPDAATLAAGIDEAVRRGAEVICLGHPVPDGTAVIRGGGRSGGRGRGGRGAGAAAW